MTDPWFDRMAVAAMYFGDCDVTDVPDAWLQDPVARQAREAAAAAEADRRPVFVGDLVGAQPALAATVMEWMQEYTTYVGPSRAAREYVLSTLARQAQQRQLKRLAHQWDALDPHQARDALHAVLTTGRRAQDEDLPLATVMTEFYQQTSAAIDGVVPTVVRTGLPRLDRVLLGGFFPGDVIVVGARTSTGKSAMALTMARHMVRDGQRVLFISLEMSRRDIVTRLLAPALGADTRLLRLGQFAQAPELAGRLATLVGVLGEWPLRIWDRAGLTLGDIDRRVRALQADEGLDVVMIDYIQLMRRPRDHNTAEELAAIAADLKTLAAQDWRLPVVVMSQISRISEQNPDAVPELWHLKGSGGIEESADVVLLLHRPKEGRRADGSGPLIVRVAKQRNGPIDTVELWFDTVHQDIRNQEGV